MSVPPDNYYSAPPPTRSNSSGCWKAAGITCGVLIVLTAVVVFFAVRAAKEAIHKGTGIFGKTFGAAFDIGITTANGLKIQQAVVKYHQQHGKYPDTLTDLVADGLVDGKILHSALDTNPDPGHISWTYTKPAEGAPGSTPILKLHYHIVIPGSNTQQTQDNDMIINLDGTTGQNTSYHTQTHYGTPSGSQ